MNKTLNIKHAMLMLLIVCFNIYCKDMYTSTIGNVDFIFDYEELEVYKGHIGSNIIPCNNLEFDICYYSPEFHLLIPFPKVLEINKQYKFKDFDITVSNIYDSNFSKKKRKMYVIETYLRTPILNTSCLKKSELIFDQDKNLVFMTMGLYDCEEDPN